MRYCGGGEKIKRFQDTGQPSTPPPIPPRSKTFKLFIYFKEFPQEDRQSEPKINMSQIESAEPWAANNSQTTQYPHNPYERYYGVPTLRWPNKDTGIGDGTLYLPPTPGVGVPLPNLMMPNVQIPSDRKSHLLNVTDGARAFDLK
jgi:hypothetical protein